VRGLLQRVDKIGGALLGETFELHELFGLEIEEVRELADELLGHEELGGLVAQALNVQRVAGGEVDDAAGELGRAFEAVGTDGEGAALR